jgi:hypothetical protein
MIKIIIISLVIGYIIGLIHSYRKERKQCLNCGILKTYQSFGRFGYGGGEYKYAVKHREGYYCKDCNKTFSAKFTLS